MPTLISMSIRRNPAASRYRNGPFPPMMAPLLADRRVAAALSVAAVAIVVLKIAGVAGWQCPISTVIGQPCPGCGLTRAMAALASGSWQSAVQLHPLAPLAAAAIFLLVAVTVLPATVGRKIAATAALVEGRSGIGWLSILLVICHWIGRLNGYW
jgi:hypothetical protein